MKEKNLAVLSQPAARSSGQKESIQNFISCALSRAMRRYHLWACALTGMRMSRTDAVRAGASALSMTMVLLTAECLPLCLLSLVSLIIFSWPWIR